jgi:hypothetical protein
MDWTDGEDRDMAEYRGETKFDRPPTCETCGHPEHAGEYCSRGFDGCDCEVQAYLRGEGR